MSSGSAEFRAALLASAIAVLPVAVAANAGVTDQAIQASAFLPPSEPMLLTRTLRRPLPGGVEVTTVRRYRVRFLRSSDGYLVEGKLLDVQTEVPDRYEALARLERERKDVGLFPMHVDPSGHLRARAKPQERDDANAAATLETAVALIPKQLAPEEQEKAREFIAQVTSAPPQTSWPADLFHPVPGKRSEDQTIPLPGGKTGQVRIEQEAELEPATHFVTSFRRSVTTRLGGAERVTHEVWTLAPDDGDAE